MTKKILLVIIAIFAVTNILTFWQLTSYKSKEESSFHLSLNRMYDGLHDVYLWSGHLVSRWDSSSREEKIDHTSVILSSLKLAANMMDTLGPHYELQSDEPVSMFPMSDLFRFYEGHVKDIRRLIRDGQEDEALKAAQRLRHDAEVLAEVFELNKGDSSKKLVQLTYFELKESWGNLLERLQGYGNHLTEYRKLHEF
ncbi:MAG: hypothetical protein H0Z32_05250 [Bacillaceae bacterium]|nr:hypothetical protein [Bacillaceae bacterium]